MTKQNILQRTLLHNRYPKRPFYKWFTINFDLTAYFSCKTRKYSGDSNVRVEHKPELLQQKLLIFEGQYNL